MSDLTRAPTKGGTLLRQWREAKNITQTAACAKIGVRCATWSEWESGHRSPGRDLAILVEDLTKGAVPHGAWAEEPEVVAAVERNIARIAESTPREGIGPGPEVAPAPHAPHAPRAA